VIGLIFGMPSQITYTIPTEKKVETFKFLGREITATESYENGVLTISQTTAS
jgi:hypothetical protein